MHEEEQNQRIEVISLVQKISMTDLKTKISS